jgi:NAD-dependent dihydropyrimidine dehydrogenase PreA subunit
MAMYIDPAVCNGCGACVEVCPNEAIRLVSGKAVINQEKCAACATCAGACPLQAILEEAPLALPKPADPGAELATSRPPAQEPVLSLSPWLGATLAFMGREIIPRLLDILEQRLLSPAHSTAATGSIGHQPSSSDQLKLPRKSGTEPCRTRRRRRRLYGVGPNSNQGRRARKAV